MAALADKLAKARVYAIGGAELFTFANLFLDVDWLQAIVGHFARNDLVDESAESEDVHSTVVGSLIEKLWRHVGWRSSELHGSLANVSLEFSQTEVAHFDL